MSPIAPIGARSGVEVERFEWVEASSSRTLLRLRARVSPGPTVPTPRLRLGNPSSGGRAVLEPIGAVPRADDSYAQAAWALAFSAPHDLVVDPATEFHLEGFGPAGVALGRPVELRLPGSAEPAAARRQLPVAPERPDHAVPDPPRGPRLGLAAASAVLAALATAAVVAAEHQRGAGSPRLAENRVATLAGAVRLPPSLVASAPASVSAATASPALVASAGVNRVAVYGSSTASRALLELANPNPEGAPLVFLARRTQQDRLEVYLPIRPNHASGWIRRDQVAVSLDPYRVSVDLAGHRMAVWRGAQLVERDPIGVGIKALTPTPPGLYYVTELLRQNDPGGRYGPYAFGLSAHSTVLNEFDGGNGQVGIHGTNEPSKVGTDVSHGCIRVRNAVIRRLARILPLGTPVRID